MSREDGEAPVVRVDLSEHGRTGFRPNNRYVISIPGYGAEITSTTKKGAVACARKHAARLGLEVVLSWEEGR